MEAMGEGFLSPDEIAAGYFVSLDNYFAHMGDLLASDPMYVMIPTDEEPFVINANTRAISIPANFSKCAGVVGDNMCEIITFTVDRYFDYVDLANTNICIQWNTKSASGISHIGLIDNESMPGKIRFGWPLTEALTAEAGNITFAIRFFEKNDDGQFVYLLNTKPAVIPIVAGLTVAGDDIVIEENPIDLFTKFVANSNNPGYSIPAHPYFDNEIGLDLPGVSETQAIDLTSDTLTFKAQALVSDNGYILYDWYYNDHIINLDNPDDAIRFAINNEAYEQVLPHPTERRGNEQYYIEVTKEGAKAYDIWTEKALPGADTPVYQRFTTLTIKPFEDKENALYQAVTGEYQVKAVNQTGTRKITTKEGVEYEASNTTPPTASSRAIVPSPLEVTIQSDLEENKFIEDGDAKLLIETNTDPGKPYKVYTWSRSDIGKLIDEETKEESLIEPVVLSDESGEGKVRLTATTPGWYQAKVVSKLNRKEEPAQSHICRVVNHPKAPVLVKLMYGKWPEKDMTIEEADAYFNEDFEWSEVTSTMDKGITSLGDILRLRVDVSIAEEGISNDLLSDRLEYRWHVIEPDAERELEAADFDETNNGILVYGGQLYKNTLDVRNVANDSLFEYYCVVDNHLAGDKASLTRDNYELMFQVH